MRRRLLPLYLHVLTSHYPCMSQRNFHERLGERQGGIFHLHIGRFCHQDAQGAGSQLPVIHFHSYRIDVSTTLSHMLCRNGIGSICHLGNFSPLACRHIGFQHGILLNACRWGPLQLPAIGVARSRLVFQLLRRRSYSERMGRHKHIAFRVCQSNNGVRCHRRIGRYCGFDRVHIVHTAQIGVGLATIVRELYTSIANHIVGTYHHNLACREHLTAYRV